MIFTSNGSMLQPPKFRNRNDVGNMSDSSEYNNHDDVPIGDTTSRIQHDVGQPPISPISPIVNNNNNNSALTENWNGQQQHSTEVPMMRSESDEEIPLEEEVSFLKQIVLELEQKHSEEMEVIQTQLRIKDDEIQMLSSNDIQMKESSSAGTDIGLYLIAIGTLQKRIEEKDRTIDTYKTTIDKQSIRLISQQEDITRLKGGSRSSDEKNNSSSTRRMSSPLIHVSSPSLTQTPVRSNQKSDRLQQLRQKMNEKETAFRQTFSNITENNPTPTNSSQMASTPQEEKVSMFGPPLETNEETLTNIHSQSDGSDNEVITPLAVTVNKFPPTEQQQNDITSIIEEAVATIDENNQRVIKLEEALLTERTRREDIEKKLISLQKYEQQSDDDDSILSSVQQGSISGTNSIESGYADDDVIQKLKRKLRKTERHVAQLERELNRTEPQVDFDAEYEKEELRQARDNALQELNDIQEKVSIVLSTCEVNDIMEIPNKLMQLKYEINHITEMLAKAEDEMKMIKQETSMILQDSKLFAMQSEKDMADAIREHDSIVMDLSTSLTDAMNKYKEMESSLNDLLKSCQVSTIEEVSHKVKELQQQIQACEDMKMEPDPETSYRAPMTKNVDDEGHKLLLEQVQDVIILCHVIDIGEIPNKMKMLSKQNDVLKVDLEELETQCQELQFQNKSLLEKISVVTNTPDSNGGMSEESEQYIRSLEALSSSTPDEYQIRQTEAERKLVLLVTRCKVNKLDEIPDKINELEEQLTLTKFKLNESQTNFTTYKLQSKAELEKVTSKISLLEQEFMEQQQNMQIDTTRSRGEIPDQTRTASQMSSATNRLVELEAHNERLYKNVSRSNNEFLEFEQRLTMVINVCQLNGIPDIPEALAELKQSFSASREHLLSSIHLAEYLTEDEEMKLHSNLELEEKVKSLQEDLSRSRKELKKAEKKLKRLEEKHMHEVNDITCVNDLTNGKKIDTLKQELTRSESKAIILQGEVKSLRETLADAESEIEQLQKQSNGGRSYKKMNSKDLDTSDQGESIESYRRVVNELKIELQKMQRVVDQKQREIDGLREEVEDEALQLTRTRSSIEDLEQERTYNRAKLSELSRLMTATFKTDAEMNLIKKTEQCAQLIVDNDNLNNRLDVIEANFKAIKIDNEQKTDLINKLSSFGEGGLSLDEFIVSMQNEQERSSAKVAELSIKLAESKGNVDELMKEIRRLNHELAISQEKGLGAATRIGFEAAESMTRNSIQAAESMIRSRIASVRSSTTSPPSTTSRSFHGIVRNNSNNTQTSSVTLI